jgi:alkanesulfonate monooxygenase SsuD/methylene tetrahydromethanopterin reductase-like flavin-dependent oxidoreductase (luciferase family)
MPHAVIRFDLRQPGREPGEVQRAYATAVEMAEWADAKGFDLVVLSEHHGSPDGYLTSPLVLGAAIAARTTRIPINVAALLVPLHDPIRLAEDITALDLISNGRVSFVAGIGYRPIEYAMVGQEWSRRGKRMDENLEVMLKAWSGEPFEHNGETIVVTPRPLQQPHPPVFIGGSAPATAKRAARFGFGLFPPTADSEMVELYRAECERLGKEPGFVALPGGPGTLFVAEDPDKLWAEIGEHLLHDATTDTSWQPDGQRSHVSAYGTTVDALRAEGVYQILTPDECVALGAELGRVGAFTHHPLCGGVPADAGWASLELFVDKVLPRVQAVR